MGAESPSHQPDAAPPQPALAWWDQLKADIGYSPVPEPGAVDQALRWAGARLPEEEADPVTFPGMSLLRIGTQYAQQRIDDGLGSLPPATQPAKMRLTLEIQLSVALEQDIYFRRLGKGNVAVRLEPGGDPKHPKLRILMKKAAVDSLFTTTASVMRTPGSPMMRLLGTVLGDVPGSLQEQDGYYVGMAATPDQIVSTIRFIRSLHDALPEGVGAAVDRGASSVIAREAGKRVDNAKAFFPNRIPGPGGIRLPPGAMGALGDVRQEDIIRSILRKGR